MDGKGKEPGVSEETPIDVQRETAKSEVITLSRMRPINLNDIKPNPERLTRANDGNYYDINRYGDDDAANPNAVYANVLSEPAVVEELRGAYTEITDPPKREPAPTVYADTGWREQVMEEIVKTEQERAEVSKHIRKPFADNKNLFYFICQLMTFFAALDMLFFLFTIPGKLLEAASVYAFSGVDTSFALLLLFLEKLFRIFVGVFGILNYDRPKHLKKCFFIGIIIAIPGFMSFIGAVPSIMSGGRFVNFILGGVIPMVMPGFYIYGSLRNMREFREEA